MAPPARPPFAWYDQEKDHPGSDTICPAIYPFLSSDKKMYETDFWQDGTEFDWKESL